MIFNSIPIVQIINFTIFIIKIIYTLVLSISDLIYSRQIFLYKRNTICAQLVQELDQQKGNKSQTKNTTNKQSNQTSLILISDGEINDTLDEDSKNITPLQSNKKILGSNKQLPIRKKTPDEKNSQQYRSTRHLTIKQQIKSSKDIKSLRRVEIPLSPLPNQQNLNPSRSLSQEMKNNQPQKKLDDKQIISSNVKGQKEINLKKATALKQQNTSEGNNCSTDSKITSFDLNHIQELKFNADDYIQNGTNTVQFSFENEQSTPTNNFDNFFNEPNNNQKLSLPQQHITQQKQSVHKDNKSSDVSITMTQSADNDERQISQSESLVASKPIIQFGINKGKQQSNKVIQTTSSQKIQKSPYLTSQYSLDDPGQLLQNSTQQIDILKNFRFKKHKLKKRYGYQSSLNSDAANYFLQSIGMRIMETRNKKYKGPVFTEVNTRKLIGLIYSDKMKQMKLGDKSNSLSNVAYDFFLNRFGFKKMAEKNLQQFLHSLQYHYNIERVKVFLRFFGIDHQINYDQDDFNFYILCLIQLDDNLPANMQQLNLYLIPKVLEILFKKFENRLQPKIINKFKVEIESMRYTSSDPNLRTKNLIDQDLGLQVLLTAKMEEKKVNIVALKPIYLAGDVDNDQVIGQEEFLMLANHIEKGLSRLNMIQLFLQNTDMFDEATGEKTMSFQQFAQISVENNLFSHEKQLQYVLNVEEWDQIKNIHLLKKQWNMKRDIIRLRLIKYNSYKNSYRMMGQRIQEFFDNPMNCIESSKRTSRLFAIPSLNLPFSFVQNEEVIGRCSFLSPLPLSHRQSISDPEEQEKKLVIWLIYRLLDDESKRIVIQPQILDLIPPELSLFSNILEQLAKENKLQFKNKEYIS